MLLSMLRDMSGACTLRFHDQAPCHVVVDEVAAELPMMSKFTPASLYDVYKRVYIYIHTYMYMYICIFIRIHIYIHMYSTGTHTHHTHINMYVCIYIYI